MFGAVVENLQTLWREGLFELRSDAVRDTSHNSALFAV
ncbi:hypothetical protein ABI_14650 [Asticcacaulis biprosthecium C19]|uniref:Uncharacterized protein n=1 Tax=Asticcacaulis biprosthecium C19 TaxID=715226 RepID=F4QIW3_9CAUL|nr:hypothetical protein ABI_14650 [Asticcacaulis biprosthecium C19]